MIRGSNRVISKQPPVASFGIHNRFDIEVLDAETGECKQEAKAYNVICDQLWTRLFNKNGYFHYIQYGSGDGDPSSSDTSLFNYVGGQVAKDATTTITIDYEKGIFSATRSIQIAAATAVGVTITEVGIAHSDGASYLCTHAMLEDMNGNRVSITKSDTDVINIYATVYVHFNPRGYDGGHIRPTTCVPSRGLFAYLCGLHTELPDRMYVSSFDTVHMTPTALGAYPRNVAEDAAANYISVSTVCDNASKTITFTPKRIEANEYNIGGFRYANLWRYSYGATSSLYEPWCILRPGGSWFSYTNVISEAVGTGDGSTVDYSLEFPFAYDAKVYVDGVETTDFTCECAPNSVNYFSRYLQQLHPASTVDNHIVSINNGHTATKPYTIIYYNPAYEIPIEAITCYTSVDVYASDDLVSWELVRPATASSGSSGYTTTTNLQPEHSHRKYWKIISYFTYTTDYVRLTLTPVSTFTGKTLHFNNPPAPGAVITADYKTDTIGKNSNHVFDMSVTIQLGEYVEG